MDEFGLGGGRTGKHVRRTGRGRSGRAFRVHVRRTRGRKRGIAVISLPRLPFLTQLPVHDSHPRQWPRKKGIAAIRDLKEHLFNRRNSQLVVLTATVLDTDLVIRFVWQKTKFDAQAHVTSCILKETVHVYPELFVTSSTMSVHSES